jgi:4-hydroxymandelate oxidase
MSSIQANKNSMEQQPINLFEFEARARATLSKMVFDYYAGGANDQLTLADNRAAFERLRLRPRMLRGTQSPNMSTTLLGAALPSPILIAPMAFMAMAHPDGELAVARAASQRGVPMVVSTMSTYSVEEIAAVSSIPHWFQLYVYQDRDATRRMVATAEAAGYRALVLTVDLRAAVQAGHCGCSVPSLNISLSPDGGGCARVALSSRLPDLDLGV